MKQKTEEPLDEATAQKEASQLMEQCIIQASEVDFLTASERKTYAKALYQASVWGRKMDRINRREQARLRLMAGFECPI